jgi:hypothetical protein
MCGIYCGQSCNEESFPSFSIDKKSADIWQSFGGNFPRKLLALNIDIFFYADVIQICKGSHLLTLSLYVYIHTHTHRHTHTWVFKKIPLHVLAFTINILYSGVLTVNDLYSVRYKTIPTWKSVNLYDPSNSL